MPVDEAEGGDGEGKDDAAAAKRRGPRTTIKAKQVRCPNYHIFQKQSLFNVVGVAAELVFYSTANCILSCWALANIVYEAVLTPFWIAFKTPVLWS